MEEDSSNNKRRIVANLSFKPSWLGFISGKRKVVIKHEIDSSPLNALDFKSLSRLKAAVGTKAVNKTPENSAKK